MKSKKQKNEEVEYLKGELGAATNLVVVKYKGLTVEQDSELRGKIRESGSKYRVVKNRLVKIASESTPAEQLAASFDGPTAIAYNSGDPVSLAKALSAYSKANPIFEFKAGMVEGRVVEIGTLSNHCTGLAMQVWVLVQSFQNGLTQTSWRCMHLTRRLTVRANGYGTHCAGNVIVPFTRKNKL